MSEFLPVALNLSLELIVVAHQAHGNIIRSVRGSHVHRDG